MNRLPGIKLENFEGPFDLLVELARARRLDLSAISLSTITDDFLGYLKEHDLTGGLKGDFLVTASTLLLIKVRQLLPNLTAEEEEEVEQLTDRLRIYQLYRQQAEQIRQNFQLKSLIPAGFWARETIREQTPAHWPSIAAKDLADLLEQVIARLPKPIHPQAHLTVFGRSLQECITLFTGRMKKVQRLIFQEAVGGYSRQDTAVSFLAVLELAKRKHVDLDQVQPFDNITVNLRSMRLKQSRPEGFEGRPVR